MVVANGVELDIAIQKNMIKHESKSSVLFRHWLMANPELTSTCAFEMKDSRGKDSISFAEIKEPQIDYGRAIMESPKGVLIRTLGGGGEPDYIFLKKENSFTVIKFPNCFCVINTRLLGNMKIMSAKKSLTLEKAKEISERVIEF